MTDSSYCTQFTSKVLGEFLAHHANMLRIKPTVFPDWYERYRFTRGDDLPRGWRTRLRRLLHERERKRIETQYKRVLEGFKDGTWAWRQYPNPYQINLVAEALTEQEIAENPYGKGKSVKIKIPDYEKS